MTKVIKMIHIKITNIPNGEQPVLINHISSYIQKLDKKPASIEVQDDAINISWEFKDASYGDKLYEYLTQTVTSMNSTNKGNFQY
ncbi:hypothetical protein [Brevibacillus sp. 179-C9.3 HS]|uniref:hypothetical protein n=1 Tax=unclassified Brevibacillus TaxID=2684853 RepID=UPI0039A1E7F5